MEYSRAIYLNRLIDRRRDGLIKVITGTSIHRYKKIRSFFQCIHKVAAFYITKSHVVGPLLSCSLMRLMHCVEWGSLLSK